jgi:hypothetical protein
LRQPELESTKMAVKNGVITLSILRGSTELPWLKLPLSLIEIDPARAPAK